MREIQIKNIKNKIVQSNKSTEPALKQLLNHLVVKEIVNLESALDSRDNYETNCVKYTDATKDVLFTARCLLFLAFRNVSKDQNFVRVPWCTTSDCINPYHFGLSETVTAVKVFGEKMTAKSDWLVGRFWSYKNRIGKAFTTKHLHFTITRKLVSSDSISSENNSAKSLLQKSK